MVRALSHVLFYFNPGPVWRVPIPNRYTAKAKLCFCKNNKRRIIISERGPEILKAAIKDVFKRVAVMRISFHPGSFFSVVDCKVGRGDKSAGEGAACQNPTKLDSEGQE
jgi:hypothetical protein